MLEPVNISRRMIFSLKNVLNDKVNYYIIVHISLLVQFADWLFQLKWSISLGYHGSVLTIVTAEMWEHSDIISWIGQETFQGSC